MEIFSTSHDLVNLALVIGIIALSAAMVYFFITAAGFIREMRKTIDEFNFTIQYPDSFELNNSGLMGTTFILFSKQTSQQDLFLENINLIIQDLIYNPDLERPLNKYFLDSLPWPIFFQHFFG